MSSLQYYTSTVSESNDAISICYAIADDELNAILSIIRTNFVSIDHSVATVMFSRDVQDLILTLVEKIKWSVKKITENPLVAAQEEENKVLHKRWSMVK